MLYLLIKSAISDALLLGFHLLLAGLSLLSPEAHPGLEGVALNFLSRFEVSCEGSQSQGKYNNLQSLVKNLTF